MNALLALPLRSAEPASTAPRLTIDLTAVAANTRLLVETAGVPLMAVVKADGFGHGANAVARTALSHGASGLGVTSIEEAYALRTAGFTAPILSWLNGIDSPFADAISADIDLAVPSATHLNRIVTAARGLAKPARVHLHLDVGMARDGCEPRHWSALSRSAHQAERLGLVRVVGIMGHFACAEQPEQPANAITRERFAWGLAQARHHGLRPPLRHLAATSAVLGGLLDAHQHTMVRVGAGLVGIDPRQGSHNSGLRPAMSLTAPVVTVRDVAPGTGVGYGHRWQAERHTRLALLPLGYADGLPFGAWNRAEVLVRSRRCPIVGRISMDQTVVDVGDLPVEAGETVTVFGPGTHGEPTVAEWADWSQTLAHEIVTGIGSRVHR